MTKCCEVSLFKLAFFDALYTLLRDVYGENLMHDVSGMRYGEEVVPVKERRRCVPHPGRSFGVVRQGSGWRRP